MNGNFTDIGPPPDFGLWDCHVHLGPSDTGQLYYPPLEAPEYLQLLERASGQEGSGKVQACVFPPLRDEGYRTANAALREVAAASGGRLRALARLGGRRQPITEPKLWMLRRKLDPRRRDRQADLADYGELRDFAGVKLLPHLDGVPDDAAWTALADLKCPVLIHGGRYCSPAWIARHILPRTTGPLIIAHLGAFPAEEGMFVDALELARREPRVHLDTSGAWVSGLVRQAIAALPEKILYGSDCPLADPRVAWRHVASLVADPGVRRQVGRENAERVFNGR